MSDIVIPKLKTNFSSHPLVNGDKGEVFANTQVWIFDLDNTLYPSEINLFAQIDKRMGLFISQELGVPLAYARHLQKSYYYQFGTTLAGLMKVYGTDPSKFLDFVHDIDLDCVREHPDLRRGIDALPGRKLIFTNGSRGHAERVALKLGVLELFEDICSIESCDFVPKPSHDAFLRMTNAHNVDPKSAAMFEDLPHNLEPAFELGMKTVLVMSHYMDHPAQKKIATWQELPGHVQFLTDDLAGFLNAGWAA